MGAATTEPSSTFTAVAAQTIAAAFAAETGLPRSVGYGESNDVADGAADGNDRGVHADSKRPGHPARPSRRSRRSRTEPIETTLPAPPAVSLTSGRSDVTTSYVPARVVAKDAT